MKKPLNVEVNTGSTWIPANPSMTNIQFIDEKEDGFKFYRKKISGSLIFRGPDYPLLKKAEQDACCSTVLIRFKNDCDGSVYWTGRFKFTDSTINESDCSIEVGKVDPVDGYDQIFANWQKQVNIADNAFRTSFKYGIDPDAPDGKQDFPRGMYVFQLLRYLLQQTLGTDSTLVPGLFDIGSVFFDETRFPGSVRLVYYDAADFVRPRSTTPTTKAIWTFKDFQQMITDTFNFHWFVNTEGRIQWEHESFFPNLSYGSVPVIPFTDEKILSRNKGQFGYKSDYSKLYGKVEQIVTGNMSIYEDWKQRFEGSLDMETEIKILVDFARGSIDYSNDCVLKDDKGEITVNSRSISNLYTNVFLTNIAFYSEYDDDGNLKSTFSDNVDRSNGFFLIQIIGDYPNTTIQRAKTDILNTEVDNGNLAGSNLMRFYRRSEMAFNVGLFNQYSDKLLTFAGIQRSATSVLSTRILNDISVVECGCGDDYPEEAVYMTWKGKGTILRRQFSPNETKDVYTFAIESPCNIILNIPEPGDPDNPCPERDIVLDRGVETRYEFDHQGNPIQVDYPYEVRTDGQCGTYIAYI